ncbi:MAG TPA: ROK family protein [Geminicoccus sp.]|uniref:ROK family protein n=1 Tax=Geminicoccus sp. TaxID=2024832 RepID=UPI002E31266E|nr:ROK family protein [Geminicoccus sp.]HEX2525740.1 ROK family protein [Geminicoccus sp.]
MTMLIGVDWGGTKIEALAMRADGTEIVRIRENTPAGDYEACVKMVAELALAVEARAGEPGMIGIGIPGSLDPRTGVAKGCNSTWLLGHHVEQDVVAALGGRPVRMENDADCLASSEAIDGAGAGKRVVFAVILGTGNGAGIAIDGRPHHGPNNSAGEWGHSPLPYPDLTEIPGPPCYCGKHGCQETWTSGTGFQNDFARHSGRHVRAADIMELYRSGDRMARLIYQRYLDRLARGLSVVANTLDPDIFVLGGGMSNVDELYHHLPEKIGDHTFSPVFYTPVVRAKHGDSSGVRGAAWLWKERH